MSERPRVLVAEDDRDLLRAVNTALTRMGAEVAAVGSGGELIERLADEGPFDLVITDVSMPWMNGLQAMRAIRASGVDTPFIVMTALTTPDIGEGLASIEGNAVLLRKPFELDRLEELVTKALGARR